MCDLMPRVGDMPGVADTDIDGFLAQVRRETTFLIWLTIVGGALAFVCTPLLTVYLPLPTFFLPAELRNTHAERAFTRAPYLLRQAMFLLKMYACMCWGQHPSVRERLALAPYPADPGTFRA
jgi:hypothetical protein